MIRRLLRALARAMTRRLRKPPEPPKTVTVNPNAQTHIGIKVRGLTGSVADVGRYVVIDDDGELRAAIDDDSVSSVIAVGVILPDASNSKSSCCVHFWPLAQETPCP